MSVKYISARLDHAVTGCAIDGTWDIRVVEPKRGEDQWDIVANRDTLRDATSECERRSTHLAQIKLAL